MARESRVSAGEHFDEYTEVFCLESAGVWAVTAEEAFGQGLVVVGDEGVQDGERRPRGHVYADMSALSRSNARRVGAALRTLAEARGRVHP